jgi:hypothetical protein
MLHVPGRKSGAKTTGILKKGEIRLSIAGISYYSYRFDI